MTIKYTQKAAGCWGDGAFGHEHVRQRLAGLVRALPADNADGIADALDGEMSDDASEEEEALEILNAHTDGAYWGFCDGDLMLTADEGES